MQVPGFPELVRLLGAVNRGRASTAAPVPLSTCLLHDQPGVGHGSSYPDVSMATGSDRIPDIKLELRSFTKDRSCTSPQPPRSRLV